MKPSLWKLPMAIKTIASILGARPQFIKAAPVSRALEGAFKEIVIHTGQHFDYDMSEIFFKEVSSRLPEFNLGISGGTHAQQTGKMLIELEKTLSLIKPDVVLVYGDTNSTLAGSLAAAKMTIPLAHIEAGLRSYNRQMPEEVNRVLTDHISQQLFCPTEYAVQNLRKEGIADHVHLVGDVMYDALIENLPLARKKSKILESLGLARGTYSLLTIHRAANTGDSRTLDSIFRVLGELPIKVLFPVHPRTRNLIRDNQMIPAKNILFIDPVGHLDMLILEENANCVMTDSGGIQKEAYVLGVRCITLRTETEWVETVIAGWNRITGEDMGKILEFHESWFPESERPAYYGTGKAAELIRQILIDEYQ